MSRVYVRGVWILLVAVLVEVGCATVPRAADFLNPQSLERLIERGGIAYTLLDVRTPAEYARGHLPTALNLPVDRIREETVPWAKGSMIIVYCASGARAHIAAERLAALGFTNVGNFGGIGRWAGKLVVGA